MDALRFACASSTLSLAELLTQTRRLLAAGFGLAVVFHLSLTGVTGRGEEETAVKPLTTKFVKRQPRLTKPTDEAICTP